MQSTLSPPRSGTHPPRSRAASGTSTPTLTALQVPHHSNPDSLGGWLRNIIDKPRHAVFEAKVTIVELGNVPQLEGRFEAGWKFRGRRPSGKDAGASTSVTPHPSLPNLRHQAAMSRTNTIDIGSTASLQSSLSSAASSPIVPGPSTPPRSGSQTPHVAHKTASMASMKMTLASTSVESSPRSVKRGSEPTPLRQSSWPVSGEGERSESPIDSGLLGPAEISADGQSTITRDRQDSAGSDQSGTSSSSKGSPIASKRYFSGNNPYPLSIDTQATASTSSRGPSTSSTQRSMTSSTFPRSVSSLIPPTRSGTSPSPSTLLESVSGKDDLTLMRPPAIIRTGSTGSKNSTSTTESISPVIPTSRSRIFSGGSNTHDALKASAQRKGTTPIRNLRQHTCEWSYPVHHTIRIPMGKTVTASGSATPAKREQAPLLGGGPLSDSGFALHIFEVKTSATFSKDPPSGMNHNPASLMHGMHVAQRHPDRQASDPRDKDQDKRDKDKKGERLLYGWVDIDLAPFAGKGVVVRSYLLNGSRTNATVKVKVEMRQVSGESHWAAPPLQDGFHATGIRDLVGDEPPTVHKDLNRRESDSSSGSSISLPGTAQSRSAVSLGLLPGHSAVSVAAPQKVDYKSYDHHLKPSDARRANGNGMITPISASKFGESESSDGLSPLTARPGTPDTPTAPGNGRRKTEHNIFGRRKTVHHHHSIHIKSQHHDSHRHQGQHHTFMGVNELAPEAIIEAIFNPRPAAEEGPMTYVPKDMYGLSGASGSGSRTGLVPSMALRPEAEVLRNVAEAEGGYAVDGQTEGQGQGQGDGGKSGVWGRMKHRAQARGQKEQKEQKEKEKRERGSVTSLASLPGGGNGQVRQGSTGQQEPLRTPIPA